MTTDSERIARIEEQITAMRADMLRYFSEFNDVHAEHGKRLSNIEIESARQDERIQTLTGAVRAWNTINSIGASVAAAIGWFK
jgi:hypothetical protein